MKQLIKAIFLFSLLSLSASAGTELTGAGASFPYPLYSKMFAEYYRSKSVKVNYQAIGSGGGVRQISAKTVDFGASDKFLKDSKMAKIEGEIVHIPTCLGAVVVTYNLPGAPTLKLDGATVSEIFLGKITKWNDAKIQKLNPKVKLPTKKIMVVHRSDGSGTTAIFTAYLTKVSPSWKEKVGSGKSVKWPTGMGAKGNDGVAGNVKRIPGAIGYCELAYSIQNKMPQAVIKNKSGNFVKPETASISAAAQGEIPADTRITLTDSDAADGYPISGFTWLLLYKEQNYNKRTKAQAEATVTLIKWMLNEGQKYTTPLDYAPLSAGAKEKALNALKSIQFNGATLLK